MPTQLACAKDRETGRTFFILETKEIYDALDICRMLKKGAPQVYDQVARELILPDRMNGAHKADESEADG